jgi:DMSO/TMAO reductase YedYZ molybdopterin-dependent catalytic subunit
VPADQQSTSAAASADEVDQRLIFLSRQPLNAESPLAQQVGVITPNALFYHRNRFTDPRLDLATWRLRVEGLVERPLELRYDDLRALPSRTLTVTLECAGNGRTSFEPPAEGEPWQYGAVSTAEWTGVPLAAVLGLARVTDRALEILAESADRGTVDSSGRVVPFARSLDLTTAHHPDTLLAYAMNGEPLPSAHGFPLRLVVPGWYGMTAVKWLSRLEAIAEPFVGFFQTERYIFEGQQGAAGSVTPVTTVRPRSLIVEPAAGTTVPRARSCIRGLAWSGASALARVEVSVDGGASWQEASFTSPPERYAWRRWELTWQPAAAGLVQLKSRAHDEAGNTQPEQAEWNRLGYANNAIQSVEVRVE